MLRGILSRGAVSGPSTTPPRLHEIDRIVYEPSPLSPGQGRQPSLVSLRIVENSFGDDLEIVAVDHAPASGQGVRSRGSPDPPLRETLIDSLRLDLTPAGPYN